MSKTIWVISELYYPEETSTGYLLTKIAEGLAEGHAVRVLCGQPTYAARGVRAPAREERNGVSIERCHATTFEKDNLLKRAVNMATISLSLLTRASARIGRNDQVLVVTNPPLLPFLVAAACRLRGAKCLLLIHDVYPEVLTATGMARPDALLTRVVGWLTRRLYRSVDRIIVLGRDMERLAQSKLPPGSTRTVIIPNWADHEEIVPTPRSQNALLAELGLTEKFVVQYAGNMGRTHGLEGLLAGAEALRETPEVQFLFLGSGAKKRWLEESVKEKKLSNVTILGSRPRSDQRNFLNACDVAIISFVPGMAGVSVPSRMYNILAAGKPIIAVADADSELALAVQEERVGWVVPPDQPERIPEAIREALACTDCLHEMGKRARHAAETKYTLRRVIDQYHDLIRDGEDSPK